MPKSKTKKLEYMREYRQRPDRKLKLKLYFREYRKKNQHQTNKTSQQSRLNKKIKILNIYGGTECCWCGETDVKVLTIDHINNDGSKHRKSLGINGGGVQFYNWLEKNKYPEGFQVLCFNCNYAKLANNGILPENRKDKYRSR